MGQGFLAVQRPTQPFGLGVAKTVDTGRDYAPPQRAMVMDGADIRRFGVLPGPGLAVVRVEIPTPADRLAVILDQYPVPLANVPIEMLHQPLPPSGEEARGLIPGGVEMFAIDPPAGNRQAMGIVGQLLVQPPFVRLLILERHGAQFGDQGIEIRREGLGVSGIVDAQIADPVASLLKR